MNWAWPSGAREIENCKPRMCSQRLNTVTVILGIVAAYLRVELCVLANWPTAGHILFTCLLVDIIQSGRGTAIFLKTAVGAAVSL